MPTREELSTKKKGSRCTGGGEARPGETNNDLHPTNTNWLYHCLRPE